MKPHIVGAIFARGGSKGVLRKNIRPLAGKPLIAYAIEPALDSRLVDRVIVSTDDVEIADVARSLGAEIPFMRPKEMAADDSPEWLAWRHAIKTLDAAASGTKVDVFVSIPPTSPLRLAQDVDACIQELLDGDADIVITVKPAERNPYFNMVVLDDDGCARLAVSSDKIIHRRQAAPIMYDMTTVAYAARPDYVLNASSIFEGKVKAVIVPVERALDIDTEFDLKVAELLLNQSSAKR